MEYVDLIDLIELLTHNTNLHICINFFDNYGNYKTALPRLHTIHGKPYCDYMKSFENGLDKCLKCRSATVKKLTEEKKPFGGFCFNGLYEYCYPILKRGHVIAVIMVGNIRKAESPKYDDMCRFGECFEDEYPMERCHKLCLILDEHIQLLLREYASRQKQYSLLIGNICGYIEEFLYNDISSAKIAQAFNYSEKYIGRLFKVQVGISIREYLNVKRLHHAARLLRSTAETITNISSASGFNNVTYFNRRFKRSYGMTPTEYRKNYETE